MITLILFTWLRLKGFNQRSLDGKLMLTLACPFSSLRLLKEKTREPIPGEKTRAQHSTAGQGRTGQDRAGFIAPSDRQTPGRAEHQYLPLEERKRPLKRALKLALRMSQQASTPPSLGTLLSDKKWEPNWREMRAQQTSGRSFLIFSGLMTGWQLSEATFCKTKVF